MSSGRVFTLNSGYAMPAVGLGTWQSVPSEVARAVEAAIRLGYRHIDAAAVYDNEHEVGEGLRRAGVDRKDVFLTSKLWNTHHRPKDVEEALDLTLQDLGTDYLDLYLIHWPVAFQKPDSPTHRFPVNPDTEAIHTVDVPDRDTWKAMEALVRKGKVRSIGVSNFTRARIEHLLQTAEIPPAVNQIEAHPYLQQPDLLAWLQSKGIVTTAYSPLANNIYGLPRAVDDPVVIQIADELGKTPAQVLIQWAVQRGTVVLPKSVTPARIESNFQDFELPQEAFDKIIALNKNHRYNFPIRLGLNIFGEHDEETLRKGKADWVAAQRKLKAEAAAAAAAAAAAIPAAA